jgi:hypothetical protein
VEVPELDHNTALLDSPVFRAALQQP